MVQSGAREPLFLFLEFIKRTPRLPNRVARMESRWRLEVEGDEQRQAHERDRIANGLAS